MKTSLLTKVIFGSLITMSLFNACKKNNDNDKKKQ